MPKKPSILHRAANTTLSDMGTKLSEMAFRLMQPQAMNQLVKDLGISPSRLQEIKDYQVLGQTEISAALGNSFSDQPQENLQTLARLYETHPWVFICTSWTATALAAIPMRVMQATGFEDGKEVLEGADETPVGKMFRWINPLQSPYQFVESMVAWLLLTGEAYIALTPPGPDTPKGVPGEMYVMFSPFVKKISSESTGLLGYEYNITGTRVFFDTSEVVHIDSFSPAGRFRGQGIPAAGIQTIITDAELRKFNQNVLKQGVHLSGTLETEEDSIEKSDAIVIRDHFMQQYAGSKNAAKIAVLWGGLKFNPQTILQKDVMMDTQLTTHRDEIIALFGYKPELFTEKFANKATAETVRRMAYEDTVLGRYGKRIESVWDATGLVQYDPTLRLRFDASEVPALQTSQKEKFDSGAIAIQSGQMTPNEVRTRIHGLEPIPGIEGDTLFLNNQPAAMALLGGGDGSGKPVDDDSKLLLPPGLISQPKLILPAGTALGGMIKSAASMNVTVKAVDNDFRLQFDRTRRLSQNRIERALRVIYRDIQKEVSGLASRSVVNSEILTQIEAIMFYDGKKAVVGSVSDEIRDAIERSVQTNLAALKIETVFDVKPVRALARLANQEQRVRKMMGTSYLDLRRSLGDGLAVGETQREMTARVSKHFNGMRNNAATIARTEILPAINAATIDVAEAARKAGVDVRSVWSTHIDEVTRRGPPPPGAKNHAEAHGLSIVAGEELFVVSGQKLAYPGDSWNGATADNTINCRCGVRNEVRAPGEGDKS